MTAVFDGRVANEIKKAQGPTAVGANGWPS